MMDLKKGGGSLAFIAVFALGLVGFLAGAISYIILAVGVASTVFSWVPQPALGTLITAFQIILGLAVLMMIILAAVVVFISIREPIVLIFVVLFAILFIPIAFLLYHASITVWEALPETYDAQASFLFIVATIIAGTLRSSNSDE